MTQHDTGELHPGMIIGGGKFALLRRIGEGGMGEVFEAEDTFIGRRVALKVLYSHLATEPELMRRFRREARAAASVAHPNIVLVHELGERSNGSFYIVQELLTGENLREHLQQRGRLEHGEALEILVPIMGALVAAHGKSIIHRDIKPENIFLTRSASGDVVPKLIDFGISKMDTSNGLLTLPGTTLGTLLYMSPQQVTGAEIDARSDVWAIGVVLFELLAGSSPFDASSGIGVRRNILSEPIPRIETLVPALPRELADIIHTALDRGFERRYSSMRIFVLAVLGFIERHDPSFISRHAASLSGVIQKSLPPGRLKEFDSVDIPLDDLEADTRLLRDNGETPSPRNAIVSMWPMARPDMVWDRATDRAPGLEECVHSAQQALRLNALNDAIARAEQAIVSYRAPGQTLGDMRLVQAIAYRWLGNYTEAERCSLEAVGHLARDSTGWYTAVGHLAMASGYLGKNERVESLANDLLAIGVSAWNGAHVSAACQLAIFLVRAGSLELAERIFSHARSMSSRRPDMEPSVRAWLNIAHAEFALHAGDPTLYLRRLESSLLHFAEASDARNACLQRANIGNAYMQLGAYDQAEQVLREAIRVGEPMKLMFITPVRANLGFTLARLGKLEEALTIETAALEECVHQGYRRFEAASRTYLSAILTERGDLAGAETEVRAAIAVSSGSPAVRAYALAHLAAILLKQRLVWDAFERAKEAMDLLEMLDGVEEGESLIRLVYVMALDATDRPRSANERLAGARQRLVERAERISDAKLRESFLSNIPENAHTFEFVPRYRSVPPAR